MTFVRRMRVLALACVLAPGLIACGGTATSTPAATTGATPAAASSDAAPSSPVVGVVTKVDSASLVDVKGLTLRTPDGRLLEIRIGNLENGTEFPPGHLTEHMGSADPVRVFFRVEAGSLVAYRLEDASVAPSAS